jgi:hypothetical protein
LARLARVKAETLSRSGRVWSDNRVKAFSLSGGGRVSQVTAQVAGLWHLPYPGAIGLAGLGQVGMG